MCNRHCSRMRKILNIKESSCKSKSTSEGIDSEYYNIPKDWKFIRETRTEVPFEIVSFRDLVEEKEQRIKDLEENLAFYYAIWGESNV